MAIRGVRGATVVTEDEAEAILSATRELLQALLSANPGLDPEEIASVFFTVTDDLRSTYPATAARQLGWDGVPMMDAVEIPVPGGLPRCIRVLIHWNTALPQREVRHVYLGAATRLRPDLCEQFDFQEAQRRNGRVKDKQSGLQPFDRPDEPGILSL